MSKKLIQFDVQYKNYGTAYETSYMIILCPWDVLVAMLGAPNVTEGNKFQYKRDGWTLKSMPNMRLRANGDAASLAELTKQLYEASVEYNKVILQQIYGVRSVSDYKRLREKLSTLPSTIPVLEQFKINNSTRKIHHTWDLIAEAINGTSS